jgi:hypothetical protein
MASLATGRLHSFHQIVFFHTPVSKPPLAFQLEVMAAWTMISPLSCTSSESNICINESLGNFLIAVVFASIPPKSQPLPLVCKILLICSRLFLKVVSK